MARPRSLASAVAALGVVAVYALFFGERAPAPPRGAHPQQLRPGEQTRGESMRARVAKIVDGDTFHAELRAEPSGKLAEEKVRLFGINAPELHARPGQRKEDFEVQPYAPEARDLLAQLCPVGGEVELQTCGRDKYGRLLAVVIAARGQDVNRALLEAGLAHAYFMGGSKRDPRRLDYEDAEAAARSAHRGIWK